MGKFIHRTTAISLTAKPDVLYAFPLLKDILSEGEDCCFVCQAGHE